MTANNINRNIKKASDAFKTKLLTALKIAGYFVLSESKKITPIDTGLLRSSLYIETNDDKQNPIVEIGSKLDYAVEVHENLDVKRNDGEPKFIEKTVNRNKTKINNIVKKRLEL